MIRTKRPVTVSEPYPYPSFDSEPNGIFTLEIKEYVNGLRKVSTDGKARPLEDQLGSLRLGSDSRARRRFVCAEARALSRSGAGTRGRTAAPRGTGGAPSRREPKDRRAARRTLVLAEGEALRAYVAATRAAAIGKYGNIEDGSELADWMKWALGVADRLDPLQDLKADGDDPADAA